MGAGAAAKALRNVLICLGVLVGDLGLGVCKFDSDRSGGGGLWMFGYTKCVLTASSCSVRSWSAPVS